MHQERTALTVIQTNIRAWMSLKNWQWMKLYYRVKPLLQAGKVEDEMKEKEAALAEAKANAENTEKQR